MCTGITLINMLGRYRNLPKSFGATLNAALGQLNSNHTDTSVVQHIASSLYSLATPRDQEPKACTYSHQFQRSFATPDSHEKPEYSTVDAEEAEKFAKLAEHWWDTSGPFRPLHQLNPVRCQFIRSALCDHYGLDIKSPHPLEGLTVLDVGCGGGILSESLARMGAKTLGIDVNKEGLTAAEAHASLDPDLKQYLTYKQTTIEDLVADGEQFDVVIASEVIEHVDSVPEFCNALSEATKPGGAILVSTINRTPQAFALAVAAAEYILKIVPVGTHDWSRFVTPTELVALMDQAGDLSLEQLAGMVYDPVRNMWELSRSTSVNYISYFSRKKDDGTA